MDDADPSIIPFDQAPWAYRLDYAVETMREISRQTDPQSMVQTYSRRMRQMLPTDRFVALSRRDFAVTALPDHPQQSLEASDQSLAFAWPLPLLQGGLLQS